jgi:hypothetical protein
MNKHSERMQLVSAAYVLYCLLSTSTTFHNTMQMHFQWLQACADKLDRELATYGGPPQFLFLSAAAADCITRSVPAGL